MRSALFLLTTTIALCLATVASTFAQEKIITMPKQIDGAPFKVNDSGDLFGKAYRWFLEGESEWAADSLRLLLSRVQNFNVDERNYYIVVANFGDNMSPMGMLHQGSAFFDTRLYGLTEADLYYIFISKRENAESFLSATLTAKSSPFQASILDFIGLFTPIPNIPGVTGANEDVWIDVRKFSIPEKFQKNSDISVIVKKELSSDQFLASAVFDNTSLERWSFGVATAITTVDDVDLLVQDGRIVVVPKPFGDLAAFGVINYHFKPVDTKQPTVASSLHLLAGLRLKNGIEPLAGVGLGFPSEFPVEVHFFAGFSVEFANELKSGFQVGDQLGNNVDPFNLNVRVRPRFGIELKFP